MAYSKEYSRAHSFGEGGYAEESKFTDNWKSPLVDLQPEKTVLALSHSSNTIDKNIFDFKIKISKRFGNWHKNSWYFQQLYSSFILKKF